jgi:hypothetical protein
VEACKVRRHQKVFCHGRLRRPDEVPGVLHRVFCREKSPKDTVILTAAARNTLQQAALAISAGYRECWTPASATIPIPSRSSR